MAVLRTSLDPGSAAFRANAAAMTDLVDELRARSARIAAHGRSRRRAFHSAAPRARQAPGPRADRPPHRSGLRLPRALRPGRRGPLRRRRTRCGHRHRHRPGGGRRVRDRGQRRDRQGRHVLPDDGEEAPPRAGDRAREPAAVPLPRRLRRRLPATPGRGLPRPRPLRPHLLQPGPALRAAGCRRSRS